MLKLNLLLIILFLSTNAFGTGQAVNGLTIATVGPDGSSCVHNSGNSRIQDAIDSGFSSVHIVNDGTYTENIIIDNRGISVIGGFANCVDAANGIRNATDVSVIVGSAGSMRPVIIISGTTGFNSVKLTGLDISAGESGLGLGGGGIGILSANVLLTIRNMNIHDNNSVNGGGINMTVGNSNANLFIFDTIISQNQANQGGGLYCNKIGSALDPLINIQGLSGISDNSVTGDGGGVFLANGCDLTFFSGDSDITSSIGINRNTAIGNGGGIYAESGSKATFNGHEICGVLGCTGSNTQPITIAGNTSQNNGGGIYLTDFLTQIDMNSVLLTNNISTNDGGGIALANNATLNIKRLQKECWNMNNCNLLSGNKSGIAFGLGGLLNNNGGIANIYQSEIIFNQADLGTILYTSGANSVSTFIGCTIRDNGGLRFGSFDYDDQYLFRVETDARLDVYHTTIADNIADTAVFSISNTAASSEIVNSIIHDATTGFVMIPENSIRASFKYNIVHEDNTIDLISLLNSKTDPLFVNRTGNDYHIDPINSPAIDYAFADHSGIEDMDFEIRGIDNPSKNDFRGPYDLGADESRLPDAIFNDGFEN